MTHFFEGKAVSLVHIFPGYYRVQKQVSLFFPFTSFTLHKFVIQANMSPSSEQLQRAIHKAIVIQRTVEQAVSTAAKQTTQDAKGRLTRMSLSRRGATSAVLPSRPLRLTTTDDSFVELAKEPTTCKKWLGPWPSEAYFEIFESSKAGPNLGWNDVPIRRFEPQRLQKRGSTGFSIVLQDGATAFYRGPWYHASEQKLTFWHSNYKGLEGPACVTPGDGFTFVEKKST